MDIKQKTAYVTALLAFCCGWGLTIAGFCVNPLGEIASSVLAVLGEAMVYTASVFGVSMYFSHEMIKFRRETRRIVNNLESEVRNEAKNENLD